MKSQPSPSLPKQRAKRAKARVMWATRSDAKHGFYIHEIAHTSKPSTRVTHLDNTPIKPSPVAVLPANSKQQARQLVRWANLSYEEKRVKVGEKIQRWMNGYILCGKYNTVADCILNLLGESPDPEN